MLALTAEEIEPTDTTDEAIAAILGSGIREILVLGRRGPAQAAFTTPELQELTELAGRRPRDRSGGSRARPGQRGGARGRHRDRAPQRRADARGGRQAADRASRRRSSSASASHRSRSSATAGSRRSRSSATSSCRTRAARIRAVPTDEREVIPCGLVLRSVGYRGTAMPGIPFDEGRATIRNDGGRVLDDAGVPIPGVYCTGWIKRGPSGVIGTNKKDATETVELLLEDLRAGIGARMGAAPHGPRRRAPRRARTSTSSPTRAGRRSTPPSARRASRRAGRASSSTAGTRCSTRPASARAARSAPRARGRRPRRCCRGATTCAPGRRARPP